MKKDKQKEKPPSRDPVTDEILTPIKSLEDKLREAGLI